MKKRKVDIHINSHPMKLNNILKNEIHVIPKYQRNYSWNEDNWEELIETIENGNENFFGTLFLMKMKGSNRNFEVIDGQQRLTTLNILIKSLELIIEYGISNRNIRKNKRISDCLEGLYLCRFENRYRGDDLPRLKLQELQNAQQEFKEIMSLKEIPESIEDIQLKKNEIDGEILKNQLDLISLEPELEEKKDIQKKLSKNSSQSQQIKQQITNLKSEISSYKNIINNLKVEKSNLTQKLKSIKSINRSKTIVQKRIYGAFEYFIKNLRNKNSKELLKFYDNLLDKQYLIRMETKDQNSVYEYFKSLNATGVQLAISDILKNNLFQYLGKSKENNEKVIADFEEIIEKLGKYNLNLDIFLLNSINSRFDSFELASKLGIKEKPINKNNLLRAYALILKNYHRDTKEGSKHLVKELTIDVDYYTKIVAPDKNDNLKLNDEIFYFYNILHQIVPSKPISFLLASRKKHTLKKHLQISKIATYVAVRHAIMPNRDMKTLEGVFFKARKALHSGTFDSIVASFKEATAYDEKKSEITADVFASYNWSNAKALAINCLVYREEIMKAPKNTNYRELSAEHIMPQKPNNETKKYWHLPKVLNVNKRAKSNKEIYSEFVFNLGNYIILWGDDNSSLGNKPFTTKIKTYKNYPYPHIKKIARKKDWTQKDIKKRSNSIYNLFESLRK